MEELVSLPGVGRKTANVILNHIFDQPAIIVDTHFKRVSRRLGFTDKTDPAQIERELLKVIPRDLQSDFSMNINLHGRKYCHPRKPDCSLCPVKDLCPSVLLPCKSLEMAVEVFDGLKSCLFHISFNSFQYLD